MPSLAGKRGVCRVLRNGVPACRASSGSEHHGRKTSRAVTARWRSLCNTLPTGAILTVLILTFGPVSGAHFNPAVSIGIGVLRRELTASTTVIYIGAQVIGAIVGVPRRARDV